MDNNIAVYIDADNINSEHLKIIYKEIRNKGRIIIKRVYGDWTSENMGNWKKVCRNYGLEPITAFNTPNKNSSDMKLTVDIMRHLFTLKQTINTFIIISSDSDYIPVISEIRKEGKKAIVVGYKGSTSKCLINSCDEFLTIENILPKKKKFIVCNSSLKDDLNQLKEQIYNILLRQENHINLGRLKELIILDDPTFDQRNFNVNSMTELIELFPNDFSYYHKVRGAIYVCCKN